MSKWYVSIGPESDTVVSTRIRLARNLAGVPFPARMSAEQRRQVNEKVRDALLSDPTFGPRFKYLEMETLPDITAAALAERHLISPAFAEHREGKAILLSDDENVCIMLCEEDHIRIQVMAAGLALDEAYRTADAIDNVLASKLDYAFNERLGYLTECPTNLGTGLRASLMLHLPALEASGAIGRLAATVGKIGMTVRGTYGEGSKAVAALYQISNQVTLGISEEAAIENLRAIAAQTIQQERSLRASLDPDGIEDAAFRALGTLKFARAVSTKEFMELISKVRLGVAMGVIKDVKLETVEELMNSAGPAAVQAARGEPLEPAQRDKARADLARERL